MSQACYVFLHVEYDGTNFCGWQRQGKQSEKQFTPLASVQATLERAASAAVCHTSNQEESVCVCVQASGRTDKGAHALDQKCAIRIPHRDFLEKASFLSRINDALLPHNVVVLSWVAVPPARQIFVRKRYKYVIQQPAKGNDNMMHNPRPIPYLQNYSWYLAKTFDLDAIRKAMFHFVGTHDFRPLSNETGRTNTTRTIWKSELRVVDSELELPRFQSVQMPPRRKRTNENNVSDNNHYFIILEFEADGFLQHQVRRMVSVLRKIGEGDWAPGMIEQILEGRPYKAPPSAPSRGLYLDKVWLQQDDNRG